MVIHADCFVVHHSPRLLPHVFLMFIRRVQHPVVIVPRHHHLPTYPRRHPSGSIEIFAIHVFIYQTILSDIALFSLMFSLYLFQTNNSHLPLNTRIHTYYR